MTETVLSQLFAAPVSGSPDGGGVVDVEFGDGTRQRQEVRRWLCDPDPVEERVLDRCCGPTLDLGCGPGRLAAALARRGVCALGVDLSADGVARTRERGGVAIRRDLFASLPGEGHWSTALLLDGNIGIGGDPVRLLGRVAELLHPGGLVLVEIATEDLDRCGQARLRLPDGTLSRPFPWAVLGAPALSRAAAVAGWRGARWWVDGGRRFAALRRRPARNVAGV